MGSRPPRHQPMPKPQPDRPDPDGDRQGLSMETITPLIGLAYFPVALGAGFIAYAGSRDVRAIGGALVLTLITALSIWLAFRNLPAWRRDVRITNERLAAVLLGLVGLMILLGGIAGLALGWILGGLIVLIIAWVVQRIAPSSR
ncbi:MAG TPA: hypothetical protein VFJ98_07695 [Mycobacteriales bacterium]|nr:hypothetical protein [Mycobacteriales bacterium]